MKIIYWLLATTALVVSAFAQVPDQTRKAWADTLWLSKGGSFVTADQFVGSTLTAGDTNALKQLHFGVVGVGVNLKQLSSGNTAGGGQVVFRPAAEYATDGITVFASGNANYEWVRMERYKGLPITPQMAGATGNGTTNDSSAFAKWNTLMQTGAFEGYIPAGTYEGGHLNVNPNAEDEAIVIRGAGVGKTFLRPRGAQNGIDIQRAGSNAYVYHVLISDMTLAGNAKTNGSYGIHIDTSSTCMIERIRVEMFEYGLYADQPNNLLVSQCMFDNNKFGAYIANNANANTFIGTDFFENDSVGFWIRDGQGVNIIGGENNNNPIAIKVEGALASQVNYYGGNFEAPDSCIFVLGDPVVAGQASRLAFWGSRFIGGSTGTNNIGWVWGDRQVSLYEPSITGFTSTARTKGIVTMTSTSRVRHFGRKRTEGITVLDSVRSTQYLAGDFEAQPSNGIPMASATYRGRTLNSYKREGISTESDYALFYRLMLDGNYWATYLADGTDHWYGNASGTQPARSHDTREVVKEFNVTFAASGDSTEVFGIVVDTSGWTSMQAVTAIMDNANNPGPFFAVVPEIATENGAAGTGTVNIRLWHLGNAVANGKTRRMQFTFKFIPRQWP